MSRMRFARCVLLLIAFAGCLFAQSFEVASIRINKDDQSGVAGKRISIETSPSSLIMRNVTLMSSIRWAYDVHDYQIIGGPDWRNAERYTIVARTASAASDDQLKQMLRALLADRFKLVLTRQSKEAPAYVLTVGKNGHRLKTGKSDGVRSLRPTDGGIAFENASMTDLEEFLTGLPIMDKPVFDKTGLTGRYDFTLTLFLNPVVGGAEAQKGAIVTAGAVAYADALERIGLKLDTQRLPIETLTIDHVEKPSEN
jgi:uncharacterized protein (TIGR03435 family)